MTPLKSNRMAAVISEGITEWGGEGKMGTARVAFRSPFSQTSG
jgi:hypothetical protein